MNKLIINMISIAIIASISNVASAEYFINIPLERSQGGFLADNSIIFVGEDSIPDAEEPEPQEDPIPDGLEGYQNINGLMDYATDNNIYGPYSSSRADEMTHKINSTRNDVIIITVGAGYSTSGACGLGQTCVPVYGAGITININGSVQDIVDKASVVVFTDASNTNVKCHINEKIIFMTMDQTTFRDEYNTRVSCKLESYNMTEGSGLMNYSVSIK